MLVVSKKDAIGRRKLAEIEKLQDQDLVALLLCSSKPLNLKPWAVVIVFAWYFRGEVMMVLEVLHQHGCRVPCARIILLAGIQISLELGRQNQSGHCISWMICLLEAWQSPGRQKVIAQVRPESLLAW